MPAPTTIYADMEKRKICIMFKSLKSSKALSSADGFLCMNLDKIETTTEETAIAMHEDGHFISGAFYTPYSEWQIREQAEYKANKQAILKYIPKAKIKDCVDEGRGELWELAEHFNVTEEFMLKAILFYKEVDELK